MSEDDACDHERIVRQGVAHGGRRWRCEDCGEGFVPCGVMARGVLAERKLWRGKRDVLEGFYLKVGVMVRSNAEWETAEQLRKLLEEALSDVEEGLP